MNNFKCKICDKEFLTLLSLSKHIRMMHKYKKGILNYYIEYENLNIPKCKYCINDAKVFSGISFRETCGSKKCKSMTHSIQCSEETKKKISKGLIESHKNGKHPGWSFINNDINKRSYPEKWFIKNVLTKYNLYSKYTIIEKMSFSKYFLDFALLDMKIDIEIDGQQHFRTNDAINHDKERDNYLLNNEWRVYRISWLELINKPNETISDFLNWIDNEKKYRKYNIDELLEILKKKELVHGSFKKYYEYKNNVLLEKNKPRIELMKNSNIDFSKYGWVNKVAILLKMKDQKVKGWMIKYMLDFYNERCFKKKVQQRNKKVL